MANDKNSINIVERESAQRERGRINLCGGFFRAHITNIISPGTPTGIKMKINIPQWISILKIDRDTTEHA